MSRAGIRLVAAGLTASTAALFLWSGSLAQKPEEKPSSEPAGFAASDDLGGAERYLTHVATDKPIYRGGETVYIRGTVLEAHDQKPFNGVSSATVEIKGPKGETVSSQYTQVQQGVAGLSWQVPEGQAGGEYTAIISTAGLPPAERKFDVRAYRAPRIKSQIVFVRDGYGPGDTVAASAHVERAEGGIPAGAKVTVVARVDEEQVHTSTTKIDAQGNCSAKFALPGKIARGEGTLSFVVEDGGVLETASKTIPILLQTVDLNLYPEGGDLVAGLPARVYLEARTPAQRPADLVGVIVDGSGTEVAKFRTEHEGRGRFEFTPTADQKYALKITEPSGINREFPLPEVKATGGVIQALSNQVAAGEPVKFQVASNLPQELVLRLSQRDLEVASTKIPAPAAGEPSRVGEIVMTPPATAQGVLTATLLTSDGVPVAERLVFRSPSKHLKVSVTADKTQYVPAGKVRLKIRTTDANDKPVAATVGLTVTDDSVLEMIDKREQAPRLLAMCLLEADVRELRDAHVYFDPENPAASQSLDLLLGTQGWRRFAFLTTEEFMRQHGDAARRVLAFRDIPKPQATMLGRGAVAEFGVVDAPKAVPELAPLNAALPAAEAAPVDELPVQQAGLKNDKAEEIIEKKQVEKKQVAKQQRANKQLQVAENEERDAQANGQRANAGAPALLELQSKRRQALREAGDAARKPGLFADRIAQEPMPYVMVREFAHQVSADRTPGQRTDFAETVYWNAGVATDASSGEATVEFDLSDSVTSFRVMADGFDGKGALGLATSSVEAIEPFYVEPKMPLYVTSGDVIRLPIAVVNATDKTLAGSQLTVQADTGQKAAFTAMDLTADQRSRRLFTINVGRFTGKNQFVFEATAGAYKDRVVRPLEVEATGFPRELSFGGMLTADGRVKHEFTIGENVVPGSLATNTAVFPTPLGNLTAALERLIQEPCGCFEQTSSTTYPLIMAQQYFQSHTDVDPALIQAASEKLTRGYQRLIGFECKSHGFEWFGADPGHEALTAYGLMQFYDLAEVGSVDTQMLSRTRDWLLKTRDGKGGFERQRRALHTWITEPNVSNGYIAWALLESGITDLDAEINALQKGTDDNTNTYVVALAANVLSLAGRSNDAANLMEQLAANQASEGWIQNATQSIVGSGGESLKIEATALAVLAWLRDPAYTAQVEKGIKYLFKQCESGRFGSTQATVLALKAIVEYDKARAKPKASGSLELIVDGNSLGEPFGFDEHTEGVLQLGDFAQQLPPGKHTVELVMHGGSDMPYALSIDYYDLKPASADECVVKIDVNLAQTKVMEGSPTEAVVKVTNTSDETVPTPVAIVGIPGGLEVRHDQLKELRDKGTIAAYEVRGRDIVLYWRDMEAGREIELPLSLVAAVPGTYTGPASRTYLYYTDEYKHWVDGMQVEIEPKQ